MNKPIPLQPRPARHRFHSVENARAAFVELREIIGRGSFRAVELKLLAMENMLCDRLAELERAAEAVADANVRSVEILAQQHELRLELEQQYKQICRQNEQIVLTQQELEARASALANANVEAVLMLDDTAEELLETTRLRDQLAEGNLHLTKRSRELETETLALADANALAMEMLDDRDQKVTEAASTIAELAGHNDELQRKAMVDGLTGLLNQRYFGEQITFETARAQRHGRELSLLFVDVDHFKKLNDTHGHPTGDAVLRRLAALLRQQIRGSDLPLRTEGSPFAARYGGEEFVVILPETGAAGARICAERLRETVAGTSLPGGHTQPLGAVTISIGVATLTRGEDATTLIKRADGALYDAKRSGRDRVAVAGETVTAKVS